MIRENVLSITCVIEFHTDSKNIFTSVMTNLLTKGDMIYKTALSLKTISSKICYVVPLKSQEKVALLSCGISSTS